MYEIIVYWFRDVLFEYHRIVDPFWWAIRPVRSRLLAGILMLAVFQNLRWHINKTSLHVWWNIKWTFMEKLCPNLIK